jgi:hypothetical protein
MHHKKRLLVATMAASAAVAAVPAVASAAPANSWGCDSSALRLTLLVSTPVEPLIANPQQLPCANDTEGVNNLGPQIGNVAGADAVRARTVVNGNIAVKSEEPVADATVTNLRVTNSKTPLIELPGTISSQATVMCVNGAPKFAATSATVPLKIGGQTIGTDQPITQTLKGISGLTGAVLTIKPGEQIQTTSGGVTRFTVRGLHVNLHLGSATLVDLIAAESTASYTGTPCTNGSIPGNDPLGPNGGPGTGPNSSNGGSGSGGTNATLRYGLGFDNDGFRIEATRMIHSGRWTRVRIQCSAKAKHTCRERLTVYRVRYPNLALRKIGSRIVKLKRGRTAIFSVRTIKSWHYAIYARLS